MAKASDIVVQCLESEGVEYVFGIPGDPVCFPQVEVIGDIANAIWQIGEALRETAHWDFTRMMTIREANEAQIAEGADDDRFPI